MLSLYNDLAFKIIKRQEDIIGSLAWIEAKKVDGIIVENQEVVIKGNGKLVIENLVKQYEKLFGQVSIEVCKDAARPLLQKINKEDVPAILL